MIKNFFKIAWRTLVKNRFSAFINIGGLAMGMAVAMTIGLWIYNEFSFNTGHINYERIAQVRTHANYNGTVHTIASQPMPLGEELRSSFADEFEYVVMSVSEQHILSSGDRSFIELGNYMQPEAPDMLTLNMLAGTRAGLGELNSILLSQSTAKKLFGDTEPINKIIKIDDKFAVKVTGVYEDLPSNSSFKKVAFIAPFDFYLSCYDWAQKKYTDWNNLSVQLYAQLNPNADLENVSARVKNVLLTYAGGEHAERAPQLFLHPMSKWHLYSTFENGVNVISDQLRFTWFYGILGVFVLLLACINFINLTTARAEKRAKEVGIRKTIGSFRKQLIGQFFAESMTIAGFAFLLAIVMLVLGLPWFNDLAGRGMGIPWTNPLFWIACIGFVFLTGTVAGSYPALYLSSFRPIEALKGTFKTGRLSVISRKALVIFQFAVSIILIIGTLVVYRQIQFAKNRSLGYTGDGLLQVRMHSLDFQERYDVFATELKNTGVVAEVAASASPVTSIWSTNTGFRWDGEGNTAETEFGTIAITHEYGMTVGWQFVAGRDFSSELATDSVGFVINETAARSMGLSDPVGETIQWDQAPDQRFTILGVVKDMVMESPFMPPYPTIFFIYRRDNMNCMFLRLSPDVNVPIALHRIEVAFKQIDPVVPFDYSFVNEEFDRKFVEEMRVGKLGGIFASLAIFISCLGLFGLASFVAEQRTKEIGVRKVLGASVSNLWKMLSKQFVVLVVVSFLIAVPVAYFFMYNWLQNYQYRTELSWWIFAVAGIGALLISLLTVSFQTIKAALANPVESLRDE